MQEENPKAMRYVIQIDQGNTIFLAKLEVSDLATLTLILFWLGEASG